MANRDHSLDSGIIEAAKREFLEKGYDGASLRKIAEQANVTIGAIRTRYRTKDELFQSLVQPLMAGIDTAFRELKASYYAIEADDPISHIEKITKDEANAVISLIFQYYDEAILLLCRSGGSRLEPFFDQLVEHKIAESMAFFRQFSITGINETVFRLLISSQFNGYRQIVSGGYGEQEARECMDTVMLYYAGGWTALLNHIKEDEGL